MSFWTTFLCASLHGSHIDSYASEFCNAALQLRVTLGQGFFGFHDEKKKNEYSASFLCCTPRRGHKHTAGPGKTAMVSLICLNLSKIFSPEEELYIEAFTDQPLYDKEQQVEFIAGQCIYKHLELLSKT